MPDVVTPEVRSRMMSGIRSVNTTPELLLRKGLHACGFRFRLHDRKLPGTPDLIFPKYDAVLFAHGCFWHGHDCYLFKWPSSRPEFWRAKISRNQQVDARSALALAEAGWRRGVVWECALKGKARKPIEEVVEECAVWLRSKQETIIIKGK